MLIDTKLIQHFKLSTPIRKRGREKRRYKINRESL